MLESAAERVLLGAKVVGHPAEVVAPLRVLLQIAVAHLHLERSNLRGATVLLGEGLGRLKPYGNEALGLQLEPLLAAVSRRLQALQQGLEPSDDPLPQLGSPQG